MGLDSAIGVDLRIRFVFIPRRTLLQSFEHKRPSW
jgi:hypothetical protein